LYNPIRSGNIGTKNQTLYDTKMSGIPLSSIPISPMKSNTNPRLVGSKGERQVNADPIDIDDDVEEDN